MFASQVWKFFISIDLTSLAGIFGVAVIIHGFELLDDECSVHAVLRGVLFGARRVDEFAARGDRFGEVLSIDGEWDGSG